MYVSEGNAHHQIEALFTKAFGRALRVALLSHGNELPVLQKESYNHEDFTCIDTGSAANLAYSVVQAFKRLGYEAVRS